SVSQPKSNGDTTPPPTKSDRVSCIHPSNISQNNTSHKTSKKLLFGDDHIGTLLSSQNTITHHQQAPPSGGGPFPGQLL
ncbi:hypothetical protein, partial [Dermacoccus sp. Tok2021]|uniref:hypothetical protein n=1 Tax=Dermacoccus sp. Tok2021 TaxID=2826873 RepID=UPI001CA697AC